MKNFIVGKKWKTRSGKIATITQNQLYGIYPIAVKVEDDEFTCTETGSYWENNESNDKDLIEPYESEQDFSSKIEKLRAKVDKSRLKYEAAKFALAEALKECKCETKTADSSYTEGGYDYRSTTTYYDRCDICGKHHNITNVRGSFN